jgi:hypothetical protein
MPVQYEITEKSIAIRNQILALCKNGMTTIGDLSDATGKTNYGLRFHIEKLVASKHLKAGTAFNKINQEVNAYLTLRDSYDPQEIKDANYLIPGGRLIKFDSTTAESLALAKKLTKSDALRHSDSKAARRSGWIGSTLSTMTF